MLSELLTNKQGNKNEELMLNSEGKLIKNTQSIADAFNIYFSTVVEESVIKLLNKTTVTPVKILTSST